MTIQHIDKTYSGWTLEQVLADYENTLPQGIRVSSVQIYINDGDPVFFNHIFDGRENPINILVSNFQSVIEPNFSEDWVVTIITTVKLD